MLVTVETTSLASFWFRPVSLKTVLSVNFIPPWIRETPMTQRKIALLEAIWLTVGIPGNVVKAAFCDMWACIGVREKQWVRQYP